jgi:pSer/pThr/pTyr-binding forkhead associated (FHA) protein
VDKKLTQTIVDQVFDLGETQEVPGDLVATLRVIEGPDRGASLRLAGPVQRIGRASNCGLILSDTRISATHISITFRNGEFRLKDLESTNGTLLNGSPVTEFALKDGDQIRVGRTVMRMEIDFELE